MRKLEVIARELDLWLTTDAMFSCSQFINDDGE